jgi:hypothetical protein
MPNCDHFINDSGSVHFVDFNYIEARDILGGYLQTLSKKAPYYNHLFADNVENCQQNLLEDLLGIHLVYFIVYLVLSCDFSKPGWYNLKKFDTRIGSSELVQNVRRSYGIISIKSSDLSI